MRSALTASEQSSPYSYMPMMKGRERNENRYVFSRLNRASETVKRIELPFELFDTQGRLVAETCQRCEVLGVAVCVNSRVDVWAHWMSAFG